MEFYKETRFKNSEIGEVPEDWGVVRLIDVAEYINGYAFSPKDWKDKGLPIIRIQNLNDPKAEFNYFDGVIDNKYIVENGDILFSWSASIGVYIWNRGRAVLNQHIFKVVPKNNVDRLFLYYTLFLAIEQLKNRVHGSTMKHFKRSELNTTFIPLPPLEEQKKIAEVLSNTDKAIQKVDESIEKFEKLKKGLMNILLNGKVRIKVENGKFYFYKETKFKNSEIGEVPEDWEVVRLGKIVEIYDNKRVPLNEQEREKMKGPYPYCGANGILDYINNYIFDGEYILLAEDGGYWGKFENSAYIMNGKFWVNNHAHVLKALNGIAYNRFLMYILNFLDLTPYIVGSTRGKLNQKDMKNIKLPLPPIEEQQKIVEILSKIDKVIQLKKEKKEKLEKIKKYFMDNLLTGKVRIKL
ncbi:restriction endonuclease subunit S [Methanocaldococcus sp.]|uniref:restriction endonuclease subunit S n=1 Tax=Methanocaldococcus sp. TaxID=2152917 RepID=UPI00261FFEE0|nr:restriction endonuclease subunit S [Methanocaldococcus sp.]MCQ6253990.1 restriction endonuclease subunit S [Methanocaldococcus sp.]